MEIEILNQEGFASVKQVRSRSNGDNDSFMTPAPVFVPFLHHGGVMNGAVSDNKKAHVEKIPSFFPIINITGLGNNQHVEENFKLYLSVNDKELGGPNGSGKTLFCRPKGLLYPSDLVDNESGEDIAFFQMHSPDITNAGPGVVAPTHLVHQYENPRRIIKLIHGLRNQFTEENLFYAPGVADPYRLPYLAYLGFDLFDTVKAARDSTSLIFWDTMASHPLSSITYQVLDACNCNGCEKLKEVLGDAGSFKEITKRGVGIKIAELTSFLYIHNCKKLTDAVRETGELIKTGNLYAYAHSHSLKNPSAAAILRLFHREMASELVKISPRESRHTLIIGQREMIHLPDIISYVNRLKETYIPPKRDILLLLPCSYKKPYSRSKTHRIIKKAIWEHPLRWNLHSVVITSPLGIVPMELENSYPARNYDIPVTGDWDSDERQRVDELLGCLIERGSYEFTIGYLGKENFIIRDLIEKNFAHRYFIDEEPTTPVALDGLSDLLNSIMEQGNLVPNTKKRTGSGIPYKTRDAWGVLTFQFRTEIAERLMKASSLKGRWPIYSLVDRETKVQIAKYIPERGMFSLGKGAAQRLNGIECNRVFIEDFHPKGTIFCVGITRADLNIRPKDEVLVYYGEELRAIGRALVNGQAMSQRTRGAGVKVRHRF